MLPYDVKEMGLLTCGTFSLVQSSIQITHTFSIGLFLYAKNLNLRYKRNMTRLIGQVMVKNCISLIDITMQSSRKGVWKAA